MRKYINDRVWSDYLLENICIDYENIILEVSFNEENVRLICCNFIGIQYLGQWDENVIKKITVYVDDEFCQINREFVKKNNFVEIAGGGIREFDKEWLHIVVELLDAVCIHIVCTDVRIS